jgi:hypothetical protein
MSNFVRKRADVNEVAKPFGMDSRARFLKTSVVLEVLVFKRIF